MSAQNLKPLFGHDDVKLLKQEVLHKGFIHVESYTIQNKLFKGEWTKPYVRELVIKHRAGVVIPYDPIRDEVVLIEQFRAGALCQSKSPWLIELVAGIADKEDEPMENLIRRELHEEAGLEGIEITHIFDYLSSPGGSTEEISLFYAKVDSTKAPKFSGLADENEDIRVHVVSSNTAFSAIKNGIIHNASAIIALQWLELNIDKIRQK